MSASDPRFRSTLDQILKSPFIPLPFLTSSQESLPSDFRSRFESHSEKGGLTSNSLVFRYDTEKADDGVGGAEGGESTPTLSKKSPRSNAELLPPLFSAFSLTTLWCIEALARAGAYEPKLLRQAVTMFEDFLGYGNHVGLYSEEISRAGEGLGNTYVSHLCFISSLHSYTDIIIPSFLSYQPSRSEWNRYQLPSTFLRLTVFFSSPSISSPPSLSSRPPTTWTELSVRETN